MIRYCITDGSDERVVSRAVANGVELLQLRAKTLPTRELLARVRAMVQSSQGGPTRVLVNGRVDVALAAGAHGTHLPGDAPAPRTWKPHVPGQFLFGVSCHSADEVRRAEQEGASFVVYSPVFDTPGKGAPVGLQGLAEAARAVRIPVLALGGVTWENAADCLAAGAGGVAGIRLFAGLRE